MATQKTERWISDIVGVLTDPIIVWPGGWGDSLPDWIKPAITLERLIENIKTARGEEPTGTDAEAMAYCYTAFLSVPPDHDWTQIYLYIATKVYEKHRTKESGVTMPDDVRVDSLDSGQMADLNRLKKWLYQERAKIRLERDRADRRQQKEEQLTKKKNEQPALFGF